jgi:Helix-turn-helix domain
MSWQATAWAAEQKTGSPHSKLLLLLLANRADEDGICWPSQLSLAEQSEQSADTVQRHLKSLEGRFIRRARNRRTRGRWPGFVYQLLMPHVALDPELPKRPGAKRATRAALAAGDPPPCHRGVAPSSEPLSAARTEPLSAASPGRSQRLHRAAWSGVEYIIEPSPETSPAEPSKISSTKPSRATTVISTAERPEALRGRKQGREDLIQDRIARRLGPNGWDILQAMSPDQLAQIVLLERRGHLDDRDLDNIRSEAKLGIIREAAG